MDIEEFIKQKTISMLKEDEDHVPVPQITATDITILGLFILLITWHTA